MKKAIQVAIMLINRKRKKVKQVKNFVKNVKESQYKATYHHLKKGISVWVRRKDFAHVLFYVLSQYYLKAGLEKFGEKGVQAVEQELTQMHLRDRFVPKHKSQP